MEKSTSRYKVVSKFNRKLFTDAENTVYNHLISELERETNTLSKPETLKEPSDMYMSRVNYIIFLTNSVADMERKALKRHTYELNKATRDIIGTVVLTAAATVIFKKLFRF